MCDNRRIQDEIRSALDNDPRIPHAGEIAVWTDGIDVRLAAGHRWQLAATPSGISAPHSRNLASVEKAERASTDV